MIYQNDNVRASTLAIDSTINNRKKCLQASQFINRSRSPIYINDMDQQNIEPLFDKQIKSMNSSIDVKKQVRRKNGSIGKIKRNNQSQLLVEKNVLLQRSHFTNIQDKHSSIKISKYEARSKDNQLSNVSFSKGSTSADKIDRNSKQNNQSLTAYKKLYDQNKLLNQVLKLKIYQGQNQNRSIAPSSQNSYNYLYSTNVAQKSSNYPYQICKISDSADNFYIRNQTNTLSSVNKNLIASKHETINKQNFDSKYQTMINEYDKKRNFVKQQIQAMKQKSSLQCFQKYDNNLKKSYQNTKLVQNNALKQCNAQQSRNKSYSVNHYNQYQTQHQPIQHHKTSKQVSYKKITENYNQSLQKSNLKALSSSNSYNIRANIQSQKQQQLDKKFKQYQQKFQKYKSLQKRNPSAGKKQHSEKGFNKLAHNMIDNNNNKLNNSLEIQKLAIQNRIQGNKQKAYHSSLQSSSLKIQKLNSKKSQSSPIQIFAQLISKQIEKDAQVTLVKQNFKKQSLQQIQQILKTEFSLQIDLNKLKLSTQQYDPFYVSNQKQISNQRLAKNFYTAYELAENYWKNLIKGRLNKSQLQQIYNKLNFEQNSEVKLTSFARQLSFYMNKTLRSRDIYLIYERISPMSVQNFVRQLSNQIKNDDE